MNAACVDTSESMAIAFDKPGVAAHARRLDGLARPISSNLPNAGLQSAFARQNLLLQDNAIAGVEWILPDRTLAPEFERMLEKGNCLII